MAANSNRFDVGGASTLVDVAAKAQAATHRGAPQTKTPDLCVIGAG